MRELVVILVTLICTASSTTASVTVTGNDGNFIPSIHYSIQQIQPNVYDVFLLDLWNPFGETVYEVYGHSNDTLRNLFIDVDGPVAGSPVIVRVFDFGEVHNIQQTGTGETLLNLVDGVGELGSITVEAIGNLFITGDITGPIIATTEENPSRGVTTIESENGSILGDVVAAKGKIVFVRAENGNIGSVSNPIEITCKYDNREILAQNIHADISIRSDGGSGPMRKFIADEFHGTIEAFEITDSTDFGIFISDVFDGSIILGNHFDGSNRRITLPDAGLNGQIIFNADNLASPAWTRPVTFDDGGPNELTLDTPGYSALPAVLGGGSIGLAPFQLHDEACAPANGDDVLVNSAFPLTQIRLRHYGPVFISGGGDPVTVERRTAGSGGAYTDVTSDFSFSIDGSDTRTLIVTADTEFEAGYEYRITEESPLVCNGVSGNPAVSWAGAYLITVEQTCAADVINAASDGVDGQVNIFDLLEVLASWGTCATPCPPNCSGDITGVNETPDCDVNVFDLLAVLQSWGACGAGQSQAPETVDDCYDQFSGEPAKLEACIEAVLIAEGYNLPE